MRESLLHTLKTTYLDNLKSHVFDEHKDRVNDENRMGVVVLFGFTFAIILVNLLVQPFIGNGGAPVSQFIELAAYLALGAVSSYLLKNERTNCTVLIYVLELPLLVVALVGGTCFQQNSPSFSFLFFLLVLPSLILDKPQRLLSFIWAFGCTFVALSFAFKPDAVFARDLMHALNVCLISSAQCLFLLSSRIRNINFAAVFQEQSLRDSLTGVYNRAGGDRYADTRRPGALLFIDLDNFKQVNDSFGHVEGDRVLKQVADTLTKAFRESDAVIRMGGDEFAVFVPGNWTEGDLRGRLKATLDRIEQLRAGTGEGSMPVTASVGCVIAPNGCPSLDKMVHVADRAMYRVKDHGKDSYAIERLG